MSSSTWIDFKELQFIYEVNREIKDFKYLDYNSFTIGIHGTDSRILEIIQSRDVNQDLDMIYGKGSKCKVPKK